jgi:hypothetical protein
MDHLGHLLEREEEEFRCALEDRRSEITVELVERFRPRAVEHFSTGLRSLRWNYQRFEATARAHGPHRR